MRKKRVELATRKTASQGKRQKLVMHITELITLQ